MRILFVFIIMTGLNLSAFTIFNQVMSKGYIYFSGQSKWLFRKIYLGYGTLDKADFAPKIKTQADLDKTIMKKLGVSK